MRTIIIAFTQPGFTACKKSGTKNTEGTVEIYGHERCTDGTIHSFYSVGEVIKEQFYQCDRILFIGAAAIAVRVIAPYLKSKTDRPGGAGGR